MDPDTDKRWSYNDDNDNVDGNAASDAENKNVICVSSQNKMTEMMYEGVIRVSGFDKQMNCSHTTDS